MKKQIVVLGAGLVGSAMARDLSNYFNVTAADVNAEALAPLAAAGITTAQSDLGNAEALQQVIANADVVVGAMPGFMGFETMKTVIEAGKNMVDISFFPEDPFELDALAKKHGVTVVMDCGVAPGMDNILLGYHNKRMDVQRFRCLVGGLPLVREWPWEYKAVFSPIDVIEEYIRPARYVEDGHVKIREALSDAELIHFEKAGTLEAWNSDGLRTLINTMNIPNMIEKTLRFPGNIEYIKVLRESGFFSYEPVEVNGQQIRPIDMTAKLLFPKWKLQPGEGDFTVMRVEVEGIENGQPTAYVYDLHDEFDAATNTISMARTTGFTCTAATSLVASGSFCKPGLNPPEYLGEDEGNFKFILQYLEERNVVYTCKKSTGE